MCVFRSGSKTSDPRSEEWSSCPTGWGCDSSEARKLFWLLMTRPWSDQKFSSTHQPGPFGDFGYGGGPGFPRHPADFFPPGAMGFLGPHPGRHHCCHLGENVPTSWPAGFQVLYPGWSSRCQWAEVASTPTSSLFLQGDQKPSASASSSSIRKALKIGQSWYFVPTGGIPPSPCWDNKKRGEKLPFFAF